MNLTCQSMLREGSNNSLDCGFFLYAFHLRRLSNYSSTLITG
jgi:hypothetical protein